MQRCDEREGLVANPFTSFFDKHELVLRGSEGPVLPMHGEGAVVGVSVVKPGVESDESPRGPFDIVREVVADLVDYLPEFARIVGDGLREHRGGLVLCFNLRLTELVDDDPRVVAEYDPDSRVGEWVVVVDIGDGPGHWPSPSSWSLMMRSLTSWFA